MAKAEPKQTKAKIPTERRELADRRKLTERRKATKAVKTERRLAPRRAKVNRRRQIDPTTCERDYTPAEIEFMSALDVYKRKSGRMFPTCSEILEVVQSLGYVKPGSGTDTAEPEARHAAS